MLVLLLVLLDADQVLPPEILRHMAGCVWIVSQRLGHLLGNHHQGEDENCHICVAEHDDDDDDDDPPPLLHAHVCCLQNCEARGLERQPEQHFEK